MGAPANTFSPVFLYLFIAQGQPTYPLLFWCCLFIMFLSIYYPCVGIIALMEFPAKDKLRAGPSRAPQLRKKSWSVNILIPPECGPRWLSVVHRLHHQPRRRANSVLAIFLFSAGPGESELLTQFSPGRPVWAVITLDSPSDRRTPLNNCPSLLGSPQQTGRTANLSLSPFLSSLTMTIQQNCTWLLLNVSLKISRLESRMSFQISGSAGSTAHRPVQHYLHI